MIAKLLRVDLALILPAAALVAAGILMLSTTSAPGLEGMDSKASQQAAFAIVGLVGALILSMVDYRALQYLATPAFIVTVIVLVAVVIFGDPRFGARRWFEVGPIVVQPSEIMKLIMVLFMARFLSKRGDRIRSFRTVGLSLAIILVPVVLIFLEPDLGTALVIGAMWLVMVFVAGARWWHLIAPAGIAFAAFPFGWFFAQDYMRERFVTFFNPDSDPLGAGYNVLQARISIGSGGWFGQGIGQGTQTQLEFLRVRDTDFIFAVLGEQLGFVGALGVILFFTLLIVEAIWIAIRAQDDFGRYIAVGVAAMLFIQSFINIGMNVGLMPVTGLTLPLLSFGRNSLIITIMSLGVLLSIGAHRTLAPYRQRALRWASETVPGTLRTRGSVHR